MFEALFEGALGGYLLAGGSMSLGAVFERS